ncbi:hypothetical protein FPV67DRAFT_1478613 [Lyophyllum atratum]|nr:hypothetical protein FPV67DRAFT_1478613 [Lyophyllum atratum]
MPEASMAPQLTSTMQEAIADDEIVPMKKVPCPFYKPWWTKELTELKKARSRARNQANKFYDIRDHPSKAELARISRVMADKIKEAKNIDARQIYTANKYVVKEPSDFSCDGVPDLKTQ